jgi:hypothetical protein
MALAFENNPNDGASVRRVPSTSGDTYIPESAHDKSIYGLNEKSFFWQAPDVSRPAALTRSAFPHRLKTATARNVHEAPRLLHQASRALEGCK